MSNVLVSEYSLMNIGDAIRLKNGLSTTYKPGEMSDAILAIETGTLVVGNNYYIEGDTLVIDGGGEPTPSETWETIYNQTEYTISESTDSYIWASSLAGIEVTEGSRWRVTWDGTTRVHTAVYGVPYDGGSAIWHINSLTDGTNGFYIIHNYGAEAWLLIDFQDATSHAATIKIERPVTS